MDITSPHNVAAWALKAKTRPLVVSGASYKPPPPGFVVVKVHSVAVNPIDWKIQDRDVIKTRYPAIFGWDISGTIFEVGSGVETLRAGLRVIAFVGGISPSDPSRGGFQKYVVVAANEVAELPSDISFERGAVLPLGISTAAAGLYSKGFLALPIPSTKDTPQPLNRILAIWGGSSSVGSCAIQLAVASGAEVWTTASGSNFDYVKKLGATKTFDYHDSDVEDKIIDALKGKILAGVYHAAGADDAVKSCARIADRSNGKAIVVTVGGVPGDGIPSSVQIKAIYSSIIFDEGNPVGPAIWREYLPHALAKGALAPEPQPLVVGSGLRSVQHGLDVQKAGVSAQKVVINKIDEDSSHEM